MYHSVATLLPDGSIMVAGSNPNAGALMTGHDAALALTVRRLHRHDLRRYLGERNGPLYVVQYLAPLKLNGPEQTSPNTASSASTPTYAHAVQLLVGTGHK
jgi:hypothetical protein